MVYYRKCVWDRAWDRAESVLLSACLLHRDPRCWFIPLPRKKKEKRK